MLRLPVIERIWRVRGEVALDHPLSAAEAFARLDPLFATAGTHYAVEGERLTYTKRNPSAQDKLATFTSGTLDVVQDRGRARLAFDLSSTALLLCFLAPLLFLAFGQIAETVNAWEKAGAETSEADKDEDEKPKPVRKLNPIDEMLGAPAPEDPNAKKDKDEEEEERHSPVEAYVLAGLFFVIYLVGRVLEPWLVKRRLRAALARPTERERAPATPA
jgi:hypothetical protein